MLRWAVFAGLILGTIYTLSPMAVITIAVLAIVLRWVARDLSGRERQWFFILFVTAIALRLAVISALVLTADPSKPYSVFFGDEWIFKSRPIWLRNVGLGIPISTADFIYAFDETGMSGHMYVLAFLQTLVGDAPYGVHLFNVTLYISAVAVLYRLVRRSFGRLSAGGGAVILLFLPSLFAWSISALKEPVYMAVAIAELLTVMAIVRAPRWIWRVAAAAAVFVLALAMEELRKGTLIVAALGTGVGLTAWWALQSLRRALAAAFIGVIAVVAAMQQAPVQARVMSLVHQSVKYHAGHVGTPGVTYQLVEPRIYGNWALIPEIDGRGAAQFVVKAAVAYFVEPLPDHVQTRLLWAYVPEHLAWLVLVLLVPVGAVEAIRRDRGLAAVLLAHAAGIVMMVALASGNIGTLIRHRGLSLPYLVWFSVLGALMLIGAVQSRVNRQLGES